MTVEALKDKIIATNDLTELNTLVKEINKFGYGYKVKQTIDKDFEPEFTESGDLTLASMAKQPLWNGKEDCHHVTYLADGGGVRCLKCNGWLCY